MRDWEIRIATIVETKELKLFNLFANNLFAYLIFFFTLYSSLIIRFWFFIDEKGRRCKSVAAPLLLRATKAAPDITGKATGINREGAAEGSMLEARRPARILKMSHLRG
jgi:hypothetical protein